MIIYVGLQFFQSSSLNLTTPYIAIPIRSGLRRSSFFCYKIILSHLLAEFFEFVFHYVTFCLCEMYQCWKNTNKNNWILNRCSSTSLTFTTSKQSVNPLWKNLEQRLIWPIILFCWKEIPIKLFTPNYGSPCIFILFF